MSSLSDMEWFYDWPELYDILIGIQDPRLRENFRKDIEKRKAEGQEDIKIVNHFLRKGKEKVEGYVKLTVDNMGDPRSHWRATGRDLSSKWHPIPSLLQDTY